MNIGNLNDLQFSIITQKTLIFNLLITLTYSPQINSISFCNSIVVFSLT
jgi:hypothetical protein